MSSAQRKQMGDFGEQLVVFVLSHMKNYRVLHVDHEGADIIAVKTDNPNEGYAISVKSRRFSKNESEQNSEMDLEQQIKLCQFAYDFKLIPAVAYVCVPTDMKYIDMYIMTLEYMNDNASIMKGITRTYCPKFSKGKIEAYPPILRLSNAFANQKILQNNKNIIHTRLSIEKDEQNVLHDYYEQNDINLKGSFVKSEDLAFMKALLDKVKNDYENKSLDKNEIEKAWLEKKLFTELIARKDGNLARQFGDFGERLVMYALGKYKGYKVAYVDYEGADLIATDYAGNKYAISVKSSHGSSYTFRDGDITKLKTFSDNFKMKAMIAFVFVDNREINIYVVALDMFQKLAMDWDNGSAFRTAAHGYKIDNEELKAMDNKNLDYMCLYIKDVLNPEQIW